MFGNKNPFQTAPINMIHKKIITIGLIALGVIALTAWVFYSYLSDTEETNTTTTYIQEVSTNDPIDIVLDFYNPWLEAVQSTSTDPYTVGLATSKILSEELRTRIVNSAGRGDTEIDPVLCQVTVPQRVTGRIVSLQENEARVLVMAKEKELTAQSVFRLKRHNDGWFIEDILCSSGEFDIPREFSFEKEGFLLKNIQPPYNSEYWHLVFEENGELGHVVPLFFNSESSCIAIDSSTAVCVPDQFTEAKKVHVYGQMTESGAEIARLQFIE